MSVNLVPLRLGIAGVIMFLVVSACGSSADEDSGTQNAEALCNEIANTECNRLYECFSSAEIASVGLPSTSAACKSQYREELGCSAATGDDLCEGNERFKANEANSCIQQTNSASCNQIRDADDYAPACGRVCSVE